MKKWYALVITIGLLLLSVLQMAANAETIANGTTYSLFPTYRVKKAIIFTKV